MMYGNHMTTAWWILASLGGLIVWGLILWTLYGILSKPRGGDATRTSPDTPSELLERRLAADEIDRYEYEQINRALRAPTTSPREEHRDATHRQPPPTAATA